MVEQASAKRRLAEMSAALNGGPKAVELSEKDIGDAVRLLKLLVGRDQILDNGLDAEPGDLAADVAAPQDDSGHRWAPLARALYLSRRRRADYFAPAMLGEPSWDMLLALYMTDRGESRMTTSRLSEHSGAPMTTALRWIDYLEQSELVQRRASPTDRRKIFVELTDKGRANLEEYFERLPSMGFNLR